MDREIIRIRRLRTEELTTDQVRSLRDLVEDAFRDDGEGFTDEDWVHSVGGIHVVLELEHGIAAHAAVVERLLHVGVRPVRTGYVEAVATAPTARGRGYGSRVMHEAASVIRTRYELGALSTASPAFYERLGWLRWFGPTFVRTAEARVRTEDDDGGILVLPTPSSPPLDRTGPISCEWRDGDVW